MFLGLLLLGELLLISSVRSGADTYEKIEELITQWAPIIWLAPHEKFLPLDVEEFLQHVNIGTITYEDTNDPFLFPIGSNSEKFHLVTRINLELLLKNSSSFIYGKHPNKHRVSIYTIVNECTPNLTFRVSDSNSLTDTINEFYSRTDFYPHFYVTFWIFYPYNEGKEVCFLGKVPTPTLFGSCIGHHKIIGSHVGDWEHVSLFFNGKPYPDKMYTSVHDAGVYYKYEPKSRLFKYEKQVTRKGILQRPKFPPVVRLDKGHPVLFSAYGSHGIWSAPGEHYYVRVPRLIDRNGYGIAWETWRNLKIFHLGANKLPNWLFYRGKWGNPPQNCFLIKKLGICELSEGPIGIFERKPDFYCFS